MAWIESHQSLKEHPKTFRLAKELGISQLEAIGLLQCLWWWAIDVRPDGNLTDVDDEHLSRVCLFGSKKPVKAALTAARLIDQDGRIHDWDEYCGRLLDGRRHARDRSKLQRDYPVRDFVRDRDGDNCRYCGREVDWKDRKSERAGTYDHVVPRGGNDPANVVVACKGCNSRKADRTPEGAGMPLLIPKSNPVSNPANQIIKSGVFDSGSDKSTLQYSTGQNRTEQNNKGKHTGADDFQSPNGSESPFNLDGIRDVEALLNRHDNWRSLLGADYRKAQALVNEGPTILTIYNAFESREKGSGEALLSDLCIRGSPNYVSTPTTLRQSMQNRLGNLNRSANKGKPELVGCPWCYFDVADLEKHKVTCGNNPETRARQDREYREHLERRAREMESKA